MFADTTFLVTCSEKFLLVRGGKVRVLEEGFGLYYGITWDENVIYVASRRRKPGVIRVFGSDLNYLRELPLLYIGDDPHQLFYKDRGLYLADRDRFRVLHWNTYLEYESWHAFNVGDQHINSIWYNHPFYYVVEHRQGRPVKRIKLFTDSWAHHRTVAFNVGPQSHKTGHGIHNVYFEDDKLFTLAPYELVVIENFDPSDGTFERHVKMPLDGVVCSDDYLRGLAVTDKAFFIGVSGTNPRTQRGEGDTRILAVNRQFEVVDTLVLPDTGQILEIRVIGELDFAHNGLRCPYV